MVFIAGQTASDHDGKVVGIGDPKAQTRFILGKIKRAVEAAGGTMNDVVDGQIPHCDFCVLCGY
jgi:enamine deaminase RidA (YjgF/YER057c/UK114 family)